jgi:glycosyltransferase involved in cell wall biosynthesis
MSSRIARSMPGGPGKFRVLLVTNWVSWAGAETQLSYLAQGLSRAGHSVVVLATGSIVSGRDELEEAGVELHSLEAFGPWAKLRSLRKIATLARGADLVHCTGWDATLWGRLGALIARRPMAITEHTPGRELQATPGGASRAMGASRTRAIALHNRLLDRFTAVTIVVGEWQRALLESEGVGGEIVHVPNAVPVGTLRDGAAAGPSRAELGVPEECPLIVEVARFAPQKGQSTVLGAVAALRERLGDVRVLFVGEGETEAAVRAEAEALGADWASFLGRREDVAGLLELGDVAVLPSTGEGLPMSLIEAIVLGTPVVATDVGDVRWLIESTGAGICVAVGDEEGFEAACGELIADASLRRRLGEAGLAAGRDFDAPLMVERYEKVFRAAIDRAPIPHDV